MPLTIVNPSSTDIEHLTSVDVQFSGVHIGGGVYFSTNHNPTPGGTGTATPQASLTGAAETHPTTEFDFTLPTGGAPWNDYRTDIDNDGTIDVVMTGYDISLHVGDRLIGTGEFYADPAIPLLIANDPTDLYGTVTITGYPGAANGLDGNEGTLHQTSGTLTSYVQQSVSGDIGGYFEITGTDVVGGMSGGGNFLDFDTDGDGFAETYLIGATSRAATIDTPGPTPDVQVLQSAAYAPHYAALAATIEALTGSDARTADDFARMTLMSAQTLGSSLTTVQGQFFHENIFGGVNADTLLGAGGNDLLVGRGGADSLDGGTGQDTLTGGDGGDWFDSGGFGSGSTDTITDFQATGGDVVDLDMFFGSMAEVTAAATEPGDGSVVINLSLGSQSGAAGGGTVVIENTTIAALNSTNVNVACFAADTAITTPTGKTRVQDLRIGDRIVTNTSVPTTVRWIGRQTVQTALAGAHQEPVRLMAGALGAGLPHRDLTLTADHGLLLDGLVINASALVNGRSIHFVPHTTLPACMTYYHVETTAHQMILANGIAAESFMDAAGRQGFDNHAEYIALYGADALIPEMGTPRITSPRLVPTATRDRLGIVGKQQNLPPQRRT